MTSLLARSTIAFSSFEYNILITKDRILVLLTKNCDTNSQTNQRSMLPEPSRNSRGYAQSGRTFHKNITFCSVTHPYSYTTIKCCRQCQNHYHGYVADSELQHSQSLIRSYWRGAINSFSVSAGRNQFMSCRRRAPRQYNVCTGVGTDFHSSRERLHTWPCEEYQRSPRPVLE